ncbi:MAG: hypothetical protein GYB19_10300 [Rhodospirillales bacterium]|nr:hypothetical protein [Rhodospirillales bacterium]
MSKATYTRGPWATKRVNHRGRIEIYSGSKYEHALFVVAELPVWDGVEDEANAHLIKAAPDLLTACKAIMSAETQKQHELAVREVEKAIAKAEGRS